MEDWQEIVSDRNAEIRELKTQLAEAKEHIGRLLKGHSDTGVNPWIAVIAARRWLNAAREG